MFSLISLTIKVSISEIVKEFKSLRNRPMTPEAWQLEAQEFYNGSARNFIETLRKFTQDQPLDSRSFRYELALCLTSPYARFAKRNRAILTQLGMDYRVNELSILHRQIQKLRRRMFFGKCSANEAKNRFREIGRTAGANMMPWLHGQGFIGLQH